MSFKSISRYSTPSTMFTSSLTKARKTFLCILLVTAATAVAVAVASSEIIGNDVEVEVEVDVDVKAQSENAFAYEPSYLPPSYDSDNVDDYEEKKIDEKIDETIDLLNLNAPDSDGDVNGANSDDDTCEARVKNGECNSNPNEMVNNCLKECFEWKDFGAFGYYVGKKYYDDDDDDEDDEDDDGNDSTFLDCRDVHEEDDELLSCEEYEQQGDCASDPGFMLFKCAKTCLVCREQGVTTFPIGEGQEIHEEDLDDEEAIQNTAQVIADTLSYMSMIMDSPQFASIRTICRNNDEYCSALAASGKCEKPENLEDLPEDDEEAGLYKFMVSECAPACQSCEEFITDEIAEVVKKCMPDESTNIFKPGDLNKMFLRIVGESEEGEDAVVPKSAVKVLSRPSHPRGFTGKDDDATEYVLGPWVVTLDNFLSDEECDHLIELGKKRGYERSTLDEEKDYDEEELEKERNGEDAYRTSQNTWCEDECYDHHMTQKIIERLSNATGIPDLYAEHLQLLSYVPGQYYKEHHDFITDSPYQPPGPRLITFFLYLNDIEEGGGGQTRLTDLTGDDGGIFFDVQPKKGKALIWPSALDEDPMKIDVRTYHEALPVLKGRKYGANAWFHLRSYKGDECDYDALNEAGVSLVSDDELEGEENDDNDLRDEL